MGGGRRAIRWMQRQLVVSFARGWGQIAGRGRGSRESHEQYDGRTKRNEIDVQRCSLNLFVFGVVFYFCVEAGGCFVPLLLLFFCSCVSWRKVCVFRLALPA